METHPEESEKETKTVTNDSTQFWMSVFQDEKLQQLSVQLHEVEAQLIQMRASLKTISPVVQVSKVVDLKAPQQRANKERERHQCDTTQLDEYQDIGEKLTLKVFNAFQATQESHEKVTKKLMENPTEKDEEECLEIRMEIKEAVDEVKQ